MMFLGLLSVLVKQKELHVNQWQYWVL